MAGTRKDLNVMETDWLADPLMSIDRQFVFRVPAKNSVSDGHWEDYHFCTRLKLEAADYFCRQLLGMAQIPLTLGLPLMAHRQFKWLLDVFFFELVSAHDMALQEVNAVYGMGLKPEEVNWDNVKSKKKHAPDELFNYISKEWDSQWFKKVRDLRNTGAHRSYIWTGSSQGGSGDKPWDYDYHKVLLYRFNRERQEVESEEISVCAEYFKKMVEHINSIWTFMAGEFK